MAYDGGDPVVFSVCVGLYLNWFFLLIAPERNGSILRAAYIIILGDCPDCVDGVVVLP